MMAELVKTLEKAFAKAEAEHTAAAQRTQELANKRAALWRELKSAREVATLEPPTVADPRTVDEMASSTNAD